MTLNQLELLSFFIIELCLVEYETLKFQPSLLAAAGIFTAQSALTGSKRWSRTSQKHTNYTIDQLLECSRPMVTYHQKAGTEKHTGVHRKYSTSKFGYAAHQRLEYVMQDQNAEIQLAEGNENREMRRSGILTEASKLMVAKLVNGYLAEIAKDPKLPLFIFIDLVEMVSGVSRPAHDGLY